MSQLLVFLLGGWFGAFFGAGIVALFAARHARHIEMDFKGWGP